MKALPEFYYPEADMAVVGGMLLWPETILDAKAILRPTDFLGPINRELCELLFDMHNRGATTDLLTVKVELESTGRLKHIGGFEYLHQCAEASPGKSSAIGYMQIVAKTAKARRMAEFVRKASDVARSHGASEFLDYMRGYYQVEREVYGEDVSVFDPKTLLVPSARSGIPVFGKQIDQQIFTSDGGLSRQGLTIIAAASGEGKSLFGFDLCRKVCASGGRALFVSLEMTEAQTWRRALRMRTGMEPVNPDDPFDDEHKMKMERAVAEEKALGWQFMDAIGQTWEQVAPRIRTAVSRSERTVDLLVIDYYQLLTRSSKYEDVAQLASEIMAFVALPEFANTATVLLSQVTVKEGVVQVRGGADLRNHAHAMLTIQRENDEDENWTPKASVKLAVTVDKNRHGISGSVVGVERDVRTLTHKAVGLILYPRIQQQKGRK